MKNIKELGLELIELEDQVLLVDKKAKLLNGDWHIEKGLIVNQFPNYLTDLSECDKIIFSTKPLEGLSLLVIEDEVDTIWEKGNRISVTTLYDYKEKKEFPNHNEWINVGKLTYVGEVIEVDKGLALKTDDGKIFKTQATYWFGSILQQDSKLIKKAKETYKFTEEDLRKVFDEGSLYGGESIEKQNDHFDWFLKNKLTKKELWIEVEYDYEEHPELVGNPKEEWYLPKVVNNQIKAVWK